VVLAAAAGAGCNAITGGGFELTDAQQVVADMKLGPSDLRIIGGVDRADRRYRVGEPIGVSFTVTQAANVAVLRVLPNGRTTLLFPTKEHPSAEAAANSLVRVPGVTAEEPGVELFEFVAAKSADSFLFDKQRVEAGRTELGVTTRALAKEIMLSLKPGPGRDTAGAHLAVRIEAP
jgi:hypothetical protein